MELKSKTILEAKTATGKIVSLEINSDTALGDLYDALCQMRGFVLSKMQEQEQKKEEAK
jgi:hypothetical protein